MNISFPSFSGVRCLMMPYIQGDSKSVPATYASYREIIDSVFIRKGDVGFLTIDESPVVAGKPHRASRAKYERAIHTEAGRRPGVVYAWGGGSWGSGDPPKPPKVTLERDTRILLSSNMDNSCAVWDTVHEDTTPDGDIGHVADLYPYADAKILKSGELCEIGILTPHESLPVSLDFNRQFIRIVGKGVHGREDYFTENPLFAS